MPSGTQLAVWGDPIDHSRSPQLHGAAYARLGLDWTYVRSRVDEAAFPARLADLDESWRGLSLTMPLKGVAHEAARVRDWHAELTGAVNTLVLDDTLHGFNTDVGGIVDAFAHAGCAGIERARILGAGATAASALVALAELGATDIDVRARRPEAAAGLQRIAARLDVTLTVQPLGSAASDVDATVATLPSGTVLDAAAAEGLGSAGGTLFEAAYAPWPSALAAAWPTGDVISGFEMLLYQAVRQVRIFLTGSQDQPLPDEPVIVDIMRAAVMGD